MRLVRIKFAGVRYAIGQRRHRLVKPVNNRTTSARVCHTAGLSRIGVYSKLFSYLGANLRRGSSAISCSMRSCDRYLLICFLASFSGSATVWALLTGPGMLSVLLPGDWSEGKRGVL